MQTAIIERGGSYITVRDHQKGFLHPQCSLRSIKPDWIIYHEYVTTTQSFMRNCSSFRGEWTVEIAPKYFDLIGYPEGQDKRLLIRYWEDKREERRRKEEEEDLIIIWKRKERKKNLKKTRKIRIMIRMMTGRKRRSRRNIRIKTKIKKRLDPHEWKKLLNKYTVTMTRYHTKL